MREPGAVGLRREHAELIAADPRRRILPADRALQRVGDLDDQVIAGRVAEAVVELFEAVEVDHHQREAHPGCAGGGRSHMRFASSSERRLAIPVSWSLSAEWRSASRSRSCRSRPTSSTATLAATTNNTSAGLGSGRSRLR